MHFAPSAVSGGDSAFYSYGCIGLLKMSAPTISVDKSITPNRCISLTKTASPRPTRVRVRDVERAELREHLQKALTALTPIRRRVFLLYYRHELPIKAIAAEIGRSEGTIKSHLRNARLQLQEFLLPYLRNQHAPWLT